MVCVWVLDPFFFFLLPMSYYFRYLGFRFLGLFLHEQILHVTKCSFIFSLCIPFIVIAMFMFMDVLSTNDSVHRV
jgi:hypothetical protein